MTAPRARDAHGRYVGPISAPGIYDVPADLYHAEPCTTPSIGASGLHTIITDCPAIYWHGSALNPHRPAFDTEAHIIGRAAHMLLLEPSRFFETLVVPPAHIKPRSDAGKAWRGRMQREGKTILTLERFGEISAMRDAVMAHDFAGMAFIDGQAERTLVWRDAETGVMLRCRPDFLPDALRHIPDYKTTISARPARFIRDAYAYGYHMRAAHYLDGIAAVTGLRPVSYYFVVQEKTPPYLVTCITLDRAAIEWGRIQNRKAIHLFAECLAADRWPGYADEVVELALPGWAEAELMRRDTAGDFTVAPASTKPSLPAPADTPGGQSILAAG